MFADLVILLVFVIPTYLSFQCTSEPKSRGFYLKTEHKRTHNRGFSVTSLSDKEDSTEVDKYSLFSKLDDLKSPSQLSERTDGVKANRLLSKDWETPNAIEDIRCFLAVNDSFVPVIGVHKKETFVKLRSSLFRQGVYPGVEYKILNISILSDKSSSSTSRRVPTLQGLLQRGRRDDKENKSNDGWITRLFSGQAQLIQTSGGDSSAIVDLDENASSSLGSYHEEEDLIELTVRPAYPLIRTLEKKWPVKVKLSAMPYVFSRGSYTTVTLLGTLSFALSYFLGALLLTQVFTLSFVNSRSMTPSILPGDLILVEKITPIIRRGLLHIPSAGEGDVVFFSAPPRLLQYIEESNAPLNTKPSVENTGRKTKDSSKSDKQGAVAAVKSGDSSASKSKDSFDEKFLATQQSLSSKEGLAGAGAVAVAVAETEILPTVAAKVVDRNPFHYRNLRPIGGNTLLVKRVHSLSYPNIKDSIASGSDINIVSEGKDKGPVCIDVRGDNPDVSLDSRQWGCLDDDLVTGRPILRVLPLKRFGLLR